MLETVGGAVASMWKDWSVVAVIGGVGVRRRRPGASLPALANL